MHGIKKIRKIETLVQKESEPLKQKPLEDKKIISILTDLDHSLSSRCISQASYQPEKSAAVCSLLPLSFIHDPILSMCNRGLSCAHRAASLSYSSFIKRREKPPLYRLPRGGGGVRGRQRTVDG